ncbi:hypothetical protein NW855_06360, partial [Synechococcus sp. RC10B2]|uniref:hypothetical protein n=1 Tax=Synechococcus sp. RC10B2 TaxID=2964530 RepID=UPI0039C5D67E
EPLLLPAPDRTPLPFALIHRVADSNPDPDTDPDADSHTYCNTHPNAHSNANPRCSVLCRSGFWF